MNTASHGPMTCRTCWKGCSGSERDLHGGQWRLVNDPGYWGAADPEVLVLGMTKGTTQAREMREVFETGAFDRVAYDGFRPRLLQALQAVGLMEGVTDLDPFLTSASKDWGFASIIRCSLTARDNAGVYRGNSAPVIRGMKSPEGREVMAACIREHLAQLSPSTRLVVLLGNDNNYFSAVQAAVSQGLGGYESIEGLSPVAFRAGGRMFVHIGHPSPLNGHFRTFRDGCSSKGQGAKRDQARRAVALLA